MLFVYNSPEELIFQMNANHVSDLADNNDKAYKMAKKPFFSSTSALENGNLKSIPENVSKSDEIANICDDNNNNFVKNIVKSIVNVAKKSKSCDIPRNFVSCPGLCEGEIEFEGILMEKKAVLKNGKLKIGGKDEIFLNYLLSVNHLNNDEFEIVTSYYKHQRCFPRDIPASMGKFIEVDRFKRAFSAGNTIKKKIWMAKILQAVSNDFFEILDYQKAGWCFLKAPNSIWVATWIVLKCYKLYYNDNLTSKTVIIDLRKVRKIQLTKEDHSTDNLLVENGPILLIDNLKLITNALLETVAWEKTINENLKVKNSINDQKLSKNNVPIIVEKCISFIYLRGALQEGIYRKTGTNTRSTELLAKFKDDPFKVDLFNDCYSPHDVANVLKRFFRELPKALLGQKATSYLSISKYSTLDNGKLEDFKELLNRLLPVEYKTIKMLLKHLKFISNLSDYNKMNIENLAKMWGYNISHVLELEEDDETPMKYNLEEVVLVQELLSHYNYLFDDDDQQELLKAVLIQKEDCEKIHVWTENNEVVSIDHTPNMTANQACIELAFRLNEDLRSLCLFEIVDNGTLKRPIGENETLTCNFEDSRLLVDKPIILEWKIMPKKDAKFANSLEKVLEPRLLEVQGDQLLVLNAIGEKPVETIDLRNVVPYFGKEESRQISNHWAITLVNKNWEHRSPDVPYMGAVICFDDPDDQILWYNQIYNAVV